MTYVENGTEKTKELSVPKTAHKLNGELMPDDKTYDSKKYPGIKVPANVDLTCSGEGSMGVVLLRRLRRTRHGQSERRS